MEQYNITKTDIHTNFFHFTKEKNLNKIADSGLLPKIGYNARYIEKNPKVFFVHGLDNLLILFDCWINVWMKLPRFHLYTH